MGRKHGRETDARESGERASRRTFLRRGGLVAAGGVAAAAALPMASAGAGGLDGPVVPVYLPVPTPERIYDSRNSTKLQPGVTRTLTPGAVPPYYAICVNLTATQTTNSGFLSMFPGDQTWPGTSSINWFQSNMDIANNALTFLASDGAFRVFCGGLGATHFVVALIGITFDWDTQPAPVSVEGYRDLVAGITAGVGTWTES